MKLVHVLGFSAATALACSGGHFQTFDDAGNPVDDDGGNPIGNGDSGCPFCGVDASNADSGGPFVCNPNPANYDVPGNGCDDDGDGTVDNTPTCDTGLALTGPAGDMAKALGLCQAADSTHWGIVSAKY